MGNKSITKNLIMNIILKISTFLFPLISFPYASRVLGPDGIGKVGFSTSVVAYYLLFSQLGIPVYGVREAAAVRDDKKKLSRFTCEILLLNIIMSALVYLVLILSVIFVPKFAGYKDLILISSVQIVLTTFGAEWLFQALEEYSYITTRSIVFKTISIILLFILVKNEDDYINYAIITVFASSASNVLNFIKLKKKVNLTEFGGLSFTRHLKPIFVFFAMTCATTIYNNIDSTMLGFMTSDEEVGYYNSSIKIKVILVYGVTALGTVLLPRLSNYIDNNKEEFWRLIKKSMHFSVVVGLPLMVFFSFLSGRSTCIPKT